MPLQGWIINGTLIHPVEAYLDTDDWFSELCAKLPKKAKKMEEYSKKKGWNRHIHVRNWKYVFLTYLNKNCKTQRGETMNNQPIKVNLYNTDINTFLTPPKRDCYPWLRKLFMKAIDFLSDFDNRNETKEYVIKQVVLFSRDLEDLCFDHYWKVYDLTNKEPKILIIGRDQWEKLKIDGEFFKQPVSFMFEPDFRTRAGGKVLGMRVIVVPWISGLFCLPDLNSL